MSEHLRKTIARLLCETPAERSARLAERARLQEKVDDFRRAHPALAARLDAEMEGTTWTR